jgi:hypothetical protein
MVSPTRLDLEANTAGKSPYPPAYPLWQLAVDGRKGKPLPMRRLRLADVCLTETEIRAENWQAARCCADRSEVTRGWDPQRDRTQCYLPTTCFLLRETPLDQTQLRQPLREPEAELPGVCVEGFWP